MKKHFALAAFACLLASPALAQTAVGVGTGVSSSKSEAGAIAVSGSSLTVNNPANTTATVHSTISGTTTQNVNTSGTQTIKSAPSMVAPGLAAAGLETCLGSVSGSGSFVGTGFGFGTTIPDPGCAARLDARTLWSMGLKGAAVARLCLTPEIERSMPDVCARYRPQPVAVAGLVMSSGNEAAAGPIEVIDGRTGATRLCDKYDPVKQKCWKWQGEAQRTNKRVAALTPSARPMAPKPAAKPTGKTKPALPTIITQGPKPAEKPAEEPKKSEEKAEDKK